jgi:hypothetical protein
MSEHLQSWAAPLIVLGTAALFAYRSLRRKKGKSCGGSCDCSVKIKKS